jgi:tetratricopeptide (TPR) repeat protein/TolB-like protein
MAVLVCLAACGDRLASKQHLIDTVWRTEFVSDNALAHVITELRTALGDDAESPRYIQTIPRRGYRLIATVSAAAPEEGAVERSPRLQRVWLATAAIGAIAIGTLAWIVVSRHARVAPDVVPHRVVVAVFENRTNDPTLDVLGLHLADSITTTLQLVGDLDVAFNPFGSLGGGQRPSRDTTVDPLRELARVTRSGLVVSGALYLREDAVEITGRVVDPWAGKVVQAFDPVTAPSDEPSAAVESLAQRVGGALAASLDRTIVLGTTHAVRLDAYQAFQRGMEIWSNDSPRAASELQRALDIDPDFILARTMLVWLLMGVEPPRLDLVEAELRALEQTGSPLTPFERSSVKAARARLDGRLLDLLKVARESAQLSPGIDWIQLDLGSIALRVNRPHEAIAALSSIPADWTTPRSFHADKPAQLLAEAYHVLGEYEAELRVATDALEHFPDSHELRSRQAAALAALGEVDRVDVVVEECLRVTPRSDTADRVMIVASTELRAHGHPQRAVAVAERAVAWLRARSDDAQTTWRHRYRLGVACFLAEREDASESEFRAVLAERPSHPAALGFLGVLAARRGDRDEARRISAVLAGLGPRAAHNLALYWQGAIAANLGDTDRAVELLEGAISAGYSKVGDLHRFADLEPLWDDPAFLELTRPRD